MDRPTNSNSQGKLAGKVALVTGAGRGIGRAIALTFAREGADILVNYLRSETGARSTVAEAEALGVKALAYRADVSNAKEVRQMTAACVEHFGRLDILVNNAGIYAATPLFQLTEEQWDRILATNLKGAFLCSQDAAKIMLEQGSGNIINLASGGGLSPDPGYDTSVAYAASKAGVVMLTKRLAVELAPHIRVNCIAPGMIDSKPEGWKEETKERFSHLALLGRVGSPEEVARVALFLASDDSAFITGQTLSVDGGIILH